MNKPDLTALEGMTLRQGEPVFAEPWEAQAFAMVINLHERGAFSWDQWANALSQEIHSGIDRPYYRHWLAALEDLVVELGLSSTSAIKDREQAWHAAAARTPHGEPIEL